MSDMDITIGGIPFDARSTRSDHQELYDALTEAALANPGIWVSAPIVQKHKSNTYSHVTRMLVRKMNIEISQRNNSVYVRVPDTLKYETEA